MKPKNVKKPGSENVEKLTILNRVIHTEWEILKLEILFRMLIVSDIQGVQNESNVWINGKIKNKKKVKRIFVYNY